MSFVKKSLSIGIGATVDNVLVGSVFEFVSQPGVIEIALLASAPGLLCAVSSGADILLEDDSQIDVVRIANQGPIYPDDYGLTDAVLPPDRIKIRVRNPTAGAITLFYAVRMTPA